MNNVALVHLPLAILSVIATAIGLYDEFPQYVATEIHKLLGFLSCCAKVIPLIRPFLHDLFNLVKRLSHLHPHAIWRLSTSAKCDLLWWMTFVPRLSGILLLNPTLERTVIYNYASGAKGIGGWWTHRAYSTRHRRSKFIGKVDTLYSLHLQSGRNYSQDITRLFCYATNDSIWNFIFNLSIWALFHQFLPTLGERWRK
jgi:hypothetical protein